MRKLLASAVVTASFALVAAAPASAEPPFVKPLPDAACNQGTAQAQEAQQNAGRRFNPHVPHAMQPPGAPAPFCMTMPGVGQPPPVNPGG